jgi:hypothetical protein
MIGSSPCDGYNRSLIVNYSSTAIVNETESSAAVIGWSLPVPRPSGAEFARENLREDWSI